MANKDNIHKETNEREIKTKLYVNFEIVEEELTEEGSIKLFNLLFNSKSNPKKKKFIKEALERFPHPDKSTDIYIDL